MVTNWVEVSRLRVELSLFLRTLRKVHRRHLTEAELGALDGIQKEIARIREETTR